MVAPLTQVRVERLKKQSGQYLNSALAEVRAGRWERVEELLWGSLSAAVKAVGASRGVELKSSEDIKGYATSLARQARSRSIGEAFSQLSNLAATVYRIEDVRLNPQHLYIMVQELTSTVERLLAMLPTFKET